MKSISKRTYFALILACILLFGVLTFVIRYFLYADRWVSFAGSPHVYTNGKLDTGEIVDRSGVVLYTSASDRTYADSASLRKAVLHLTGDRAGNIPARVLQAYASKLFGYDKLNGTAAMEASGGLLRLTVSAQVQAIAMQAMDGRKGAVGVYNYRTGEILCAVSSPSFDPLDPPDLSTSNTDGRWDGVYVYRFFHSAYTPGSIFKLTTLAAALDLDPGLAERTFTCEGSLVLNGERITCPKAHGELTLREALASSCNCTFAQIAVQTGKRPSPIQALYFLIFELALQQIDGNIIGPRILGGRLGISDFWVLVSITVFGTLFGFGGMLLGVPVFTVIYTLVSQAITGALRKKQLPESTDCYYSILAVEDLNDHEKNFGEATTFFSGDTFETEYDPDDDFEYEDASE